MKHRIWKRMALGAMAAMLLWATACTEGQSSGGNAADEGETTVSKATITMEDGQQIHMTLDGGRKPRSLWKTSPSWPRKGFTMD